MRNILLLVLILLSLTVRSQQARKINGYLSLQYTHTLKDITLGNNPWGIGVGFQGFVNTGRTFRLVLDVTGDVYLEDDKVGRSGPAGEPIPDVPAMVNTFAGVQAIAGHRVTFSLVAGPSFINREIRWGGKPSLAVYLSNKQRTEIKASYLHIFNRDKRTKEDFTSYSFAISFRLF